MFKQLDSQSTRASLIGTIQTLASSLDLETVAEGVELPEQLEEITRLGCDLVQGFLYSRPVTADDLPATIQSIQAQIKQNSTLRRIG